MSSQAFTIPDNPLLFVGEQDKSNSKVHKWYGRREYASVRY